MNQWDRLECMARSIDLEGGMEAQVADPLWMLARQWQVLEFEGDDAAQPAAARITGQNVPLSWLQGNGNQQHPFSSATPLEKVVETTPVPDFGAAGMHTAVRASRRLIRMLSSAGLSAAVEALRSTFALRVPDRMVHFGNVGTQLAALFSRKGMDVTKLASADPSEIEKALAETVAAKDLARAEKIVAEWAAWYRQRDGEISDPFWNAERMEYSFSMGAGDETAQQPVGVTLNVPEHNGAHLDWYSFNVVSTQGDPTQARTHTLTSIPTPVRYRGMPVSRWWQFEDGAVNFGDSEAGPADLTRLLVAEFATVYSNDWFVIPVTVPVGSLSQMMYLEVIDNFGGRNRILSTAANDQKQFGRDRPWRMFELSGDELSKEHPSPWLLVAPTLTGDVNGPVLEHVLLARDEGANLVWGVESKVEGLLGRAVNRAEAWFAAQQTKVTNEPADPSASALIYSDQWWRYQLESSAPPWWIPLLSERIERGKPQVRFRRARMHTWDLYVEQGLSYQVGPQGLFLDPRQPCWIAEEEVPFMGVRLERRWQFGRWSDGSYHLWLQRRKFAGRGERSGGIRWDALLNEVEKSA